MLQICVDDYYPDGLTHANFASSPSNNLKDAMTSYDLVT